MITVLIWCLLITITRSAPVLNHLYYPGEGVELLDTNNFTQTVENSSTAWLVEFYASWCGDCQRFVPIWKKLANDVQQWSYMMKVGVLACSDEINTDICRRYNITRYPTVRYFHENYQTTEADLGKSVVHDEEITVDDLKKKIDQRLVKETEEGRGKMYPNLQPYTDSRGENLFNNMPEEVQFVFLVVESDDSYLGVELALDLHKTPSIAVRYASSANAPLVGNLHIDRFPHILVWERNNNNERVSNSNSKSHVLRKIKKFLNAKGIKPVEDVKELISVKRAKEDPSVKTLRDHIKKMGDVIFQVDLETALRYSLKKEISAVPVIKSKQLQALNDYLSVIKDYFPFGYNNSGFIDDLTNFTSHVEEVEGSQIESLVKQIEDKTFSSPQKFLGCLGSSPTYKGYPCSLWRLFHYLTVNFAIENANNTDVNPLRVLNAIHGYVKHFFSCRHCSEHFQRMAEERNMKGVSSLSQQVLWLWEAHNAVNKRLERDATEDPEYPKTQFPSQENCPECYEKEGSWNRSRVLKYLEKMYGKYNVRYVGSDTTVLFPGLE